MKKVKVFKLSPKEELDYRGYRKRALDKNIEFKVSRNRFKHLISSDCMYCGSKPRKYSDGLIRNGIDRVDNNKGYEHSNIITSCSTCNMMKGGNDYFEFVKKCELITRRRKETSKKRLEFTSNVCYIRS